jgi:hypothetical protein
MKKIEEYNLTEEDIVAAIDYWLHLAHSVDNKVEFDIRFSVDRVAVAPPEGAFVGGMSDYTKQQISAVAAVKIKG